MPRVKLPNGQALNFPEGTSEEVMRNAIYRNFPEYATQSTNKKEITQNENTQQGFFNKLPRNIGAGLLEAARGIGNIPHALHLPYAPHFEETDFGKMLGLTGAATLSDKLIQGLAQFAPAIAAPEAQLGRAGQLIEKIPKAGKFIKSAIGNALPTSVYTATQEEESPFSEAAKAGATTLPFTALSQAIATKNPLIKALARAGLAGAGGGAGYLGAEALGLPKTAQLAAGGAGALLGGIGKNPKLEAQRQIKSAAKGTNYQDKLAAAERLGLTHLTPAEATGSPYLGAIQGNIGKSEDSSKLLYERGAARIESEKKAIDKLLNTTFEKEKMEPEVARLYKEAGSKMVPEDALESLKDNEVYKRAKNVAENKTAFKEGLKGVPENSIAYQDIINRSLNDMIQSAIKKGNNDEARIMKQTQKHFLNKLDEVSPEFKEARALHERKEVRKTIEKAFDAKDMRGTTMYKVIENKTKYEDLLHHLRNVPAAQEQLKDMRLVFKDLINPPTVRTAAGKTSSGVNQERSTGKYYAEMLKQAFSGGKRDKMLVDLITNPKWAQDLKKIKDISNGKERAIKAINLLGKVTATENVKDKKQRPLEIELVKKIE